MTTREISAIVRTSDDGHEVRTVCPEVGLFRPHVAIGDLVHPGTLLGELATLGRNSRVVAPEGARGIVTVVVAPGTAADYGAPLVTLDPRARGAIAGAGSAGHGPRASTDGTRVFRAPTSGRFYLRPGPGKPAFVEVGSELSAGTTICLLEVMKTFHRVTYAVTGDLPERARVTAVLVADGADVNAGDPLLSLA